MKKIYMILLGGALAASAFGQDFRATQHRAPQPRAAHVVPKPASAGALVDGVREGNPLQMFNPIAPSEYGTGEQYVYHGDEQGTDDPALHPRGHRARPLGLKLFAFEW